jgi:hypothetical protein
MGRRFSCSAYFGYMELIVDLQRRLSSLLRKPPDLLSQRQLTTSKPLPTDQEKIAVLLCCAVPALGRLFGITGFRDLLLKRQRRQFCRSRPHILSL